MIIFLDIDGVLHPDRAAIEDGFCCRYVLWEILRKREFLKVVISSEWRKHHNLEEIIEFILKGGGEDIKSKFLGLTPILPGSGYEYSGREKECLLWLEENNHKETKWLAIDDIAGNFKYGSDCLFLVNYKTGLVKEDIPIILNKIDLLNLNVD